MLWIAGVLGTSVCTVWVLQGTSVDSVSCVHGSEIVVSNSVFALAGHAK